MHNEVMMKEDSRRSMQRKKKTTGKVQASTVANIYSRSESQRFTDCICHELLKTPTRICLKKRSHRNRFWRYPEVLYRMFLSFFFCKITVKPQKIEKKLDETRNFQTVPGQSGGRRVDKWHRRNRWRRPGCWGKTAKQRKITLSD